MTCLADLPTDSIARQVEELGREISLHKGNRLALDLTRGKPAPEQLDLAAGLDALVAGDYIAADGTDTRNYGQLRGIAEARALGGEIMEVPAESVLCWGNSSLALMYLTVELAMERGLWGDGRSWSTADKPELLTPVPGYDRHFTLTDALGLGMHNVEMTAEGPNISEIESLVASDPSFKGIWCVPKYSNPTGCIYSDSVVERLAKLPKTAAADDFVVLWDNAYAVHDFEFPRAPLKSIGRAAAAAGTADHVVQFASTSKITYASGGLGFMAASERVLATVEARLSSASVGPDKVNQLRHARFLGGHVVEHMARHAELLRPKFELVGQILSDGLTDPDIASWTMPKGGYFVSLDVRPGLARIIGALAAETGLAITPPGATFPYQQDPEDKNLRIAPTFASLDDLRAAMEVLVSCIRLATLRAELESRGYIE